MPNDNANPLRRSDERRRLTPLRSIAEETWWRLPVNVTAIEGTITSHLEGNEECISAIESALRGVVEECAEIVKPQLGGSYGGDTYNFLLSRYDEIRSHFLTPEKPTEKEPQR